MNFGMTGETVESSVAELEKILVGNVQGYPWPSLLYPTFIKTVYSDGFGLLLSDKDNLQIKRTHTKTQNWYYFSIIYKNLFLT